MPTPFKITRTVALGSIATILVLLTLLDNFSSRNTPPAAKPAPQTEQEVAPPATVQATAQPVSKRAQASSASQLWQRVRGLSQLQENAPEIASVYRQIALPYAELMANMAVVHDADETPEEATRRALPALLASTVRIKALLVADGAVSSRGNTLQSVNLSLESADSQAMQQAIIALGNPTAGMVWRELALGTDSEQRLITLNGVLSILAVRYAE